MYNMIYVYVLPFYEPLFNKTSSKAQLLTDADQKYAIDLTAQN